MKRLSIVALIALVGLAGTASTASAQVVEILPQIGVSFPMYTGDGVDSSTGIGFEAGGKVRIGGRFYVEPGIFWAYNTAEVAESGEEKANLGISDVRIPLVLGFKIIKSRVIALRIFAGAYPAFVASVSDDDELRDIVKDDLNSTLWSGRAGAGLDFTLISFDIGYDFGLTEIVDKNKYPDAPSIKKNMFYLEFGLRFGF
jgi:hypothetical protein